MKLCKTCKHHYAGPEEPGIRHNECRNMKLFGMGPNMPGGAWAEGRAGQYDGQVIMTGPDFGCIHHEAKE